MRSDERDLREFLVRAARGDGAAFDEFYRLTSASVAHYVRRFLPNSAAADCVQEVYLRLWRSLPRYSSQRSSLTWLFMLTHRSVVDEARRLAARRDIPTEHLPERSASFDPLLSEISQLTLALPNELRTVLILSAVMEFQYNEIAEILECPIGTVRSRLHTARKRMAELLDEEPLPTTRIRNSSL